MQLCRKSIFQGRGLIRGEKKRGAFGDNSVKGYLCAQNHVAGMKQKRTITLLLFCISIFMLMVPVLPHHHHADGHLCMKADQPVSCCHHTPDDGTPHHCCNDTCCPTSHFVQRTPQEHHWNMAPHYQWVALIYYPAILSLGLQADLLAAPCPPYYIEALHGICLGGCRALRAPPSC